jgi:hypothetical protein
MSSAITIGLPVSFASSLAHAFGITLRHVDARADCGRAHVLAVEVLLGVLQERDLALDRGRERVELLAHGHRHRVLQLGAAHLHDVHVLVALGPERRGELRQLADQLVVPHEQGDLDRGGVGVVRRLRHVEVVVRLEVLVFALLVAAELEPTFASTRWHSCSSTCPRHPGTSRP